MRTISQIIDDATVTPEIDEPFKKIKKELKAPFTPNFFRVWGTSSESLNGIWPVIDHILTSGRVGRRLKEMIFVAFSSLKRCHYCEAAHHAFCLHLGLTPEQIQNLIQNYTIDQADGAKDKATIDFAVRLAKDSHSSSEKDFQMLDELGLDNEEVMEIIAMSGMAVFFHLANATKINIDDRFNEILSKVPENNLYASWATKLPSHKNSYYAKQ